MDKIKNIAIIHYLPIEFYPPVTNFLNYLNETRPVFNLTVYTSKNNKNRDQYNIGFTTIIRSNFPSQKDNAIKRLFKYVKFNLRVLLGLIKLKPEKILYYESYSSYPVYLYKKFFHSKVEVLIHNHEYFNKSWYESGMRMVRHYQKKEQDFLYRKAKWISQTNNKRLEMFYADNPYIDEIVLKILPNYPSMNWPKQRTLANIEFPIKIIYVGSLSKDNCYIEEFCTYVMAQQDQIQFDIYSYNLDEVTHNYLANLGVKNINYYSEGIEYSKLSKKLVNYDVGIILYKAKSLNFKYNAPNKLFEYLSCGLDVWYPKEMEGIKEYDRTNSYPKVVGLNFKNLDQLDLNSLIDRENIPEKSYDLFYEKVYCDLANKLSESYE